jgi:IS4 transposase
MNNILALLQPIRNSVSKTTLRQMSRIIAAMLSMTGRVTMLGLSRWAEKGGSYRTVQRFFHTAIPWATLFWEFFSKHLLDPQETYILAGDESVVTKAGEKTHGLDYFFSGLLKRTVPGLSFFTLSLIGTQRRQSFPVLVRQMVLGCVHFIFIVEAILSSSLICSLLSLYSPFKYPCIIKR